MWHISQVADSHPQPDILDFLFSWPVLNFNATLEAREIQLLFTEFVKWLKRHELIFSAKSAEIEIQFTGKY